MPKLCWLSDSPYTNTGFSSQSLYLLNGLAEKGWDIHYFAHNYVGQTLPPGQKLMDGTEFKFTIYGNGRAPYSQDLLELRMRELKPDVFGVLLDTFMLYPWYMDQNYAPAKTAWWFPSDGGGRLPMGCENILAKVDLPIGMARFAQEQAKKVHGLNTGFIPHGVDTDIYFPEDKEIAKAKFGLQGKFVVGCMYRNQPRKMADRQIKSFAKFARGKEDVVMLIHSDPNDPAASFNTGDLINKLKIQNKVRFTGMKYHQGFTYEQMRDVYNAMDVSFSSTSGEGFGVGTIEAMACKVPVIITDYTTTEELVKEHKAGLTVRLVGCPDVNYKDMDPLEYDDLVANGTIVGSWQVERGLFDIEHGVEQLTYAYSSPEMRKIWGENGKKAVDKYYSWPIIIDAWDKQLRKLIEE